MICMPSKTNKPCGSMISFGWRGWNKATPRLISLRDLLLISNKLLCHWILLPLASCWGINTPRLGSTVRFLRCLGLLGKFRGLLAPSCSRVPPLSKHLGEFLGGVVTTRKVAMDTSLLCLRRWGSCPIFKAPIPKLICWIKMDTPHG